jgi:ubiquinone/menaquinone biosynthesis C-methylase UbiE
MPPNAGTGPGAITPDGCAVDFYALLPPAGEAEIVHAAVPPGASVLELGCGTGRILRRLAALGHPVLGVDESAEMLARATDVDTVRAPIQGLRLGRRFGAVLVASTLVNTPEPELRDAMLDAARRHIEPGGRVVVQRHRPEWFDTAEPSTVERDGIRYTLGEVHRDGPLLTTTVRYEVGDDRWTHAFTARRLTDEETVAVLSRAGFGDVRWLTDDRTWLAASAA